ncbi:MAG: methyl-accepting chemotaxis protein [Desulforhopalus sp.]
MLAKKVGKTGYAYMINNSGIIIAHPVKKHVLKLDLKTVAGMEEISKGMLAGNSDVKEYIFQEVDKIAGYVPIELTGWSVAITQNKADFLEASMAIRNYIIFITIISVSLVCLAIFIVSRSITRPINNAVASLKDIAQGEGDLTMRLPVTSSDEIGELATWFNTFIVKLQKIITEIGENTRSVDTAVGGLTEISNNLSSTASETSSRSENVAAAAEEMSVNMNSVAAGMEQSTTNTSMVASAAEEMTATINEIAANSGKAHSITEQAVNQAKNTSNKMNELSDAAQAISKVTETITEISEQTNLLALNATIEAARAGEAGKDFAVVANEIKELAKQTAEATLDIKKQIDGVQGTTSSTIDEINQISSIINSVNEIVSTISVSVNEQSTATNEIATNISQASQGMGEVNENVNQITTVAGSITEDIGNVNMAAREISKSSDSVKESAEGLGQLASRLHNIVNTFKV